MLPQQKDLFTRRFRNVRRREDEAHSLHIPLVSLLRWVMKPDVLWRHVPNGEHRDFKTARKLKAMGVLPGCADLEFFWRDGRLRVLFMELKMPKNKLSETQSLFANRAQAIGAEHVTVKSIDDALDLLRERKLLRSDVRIDSLVPISRSKVKRAVTGSKPTETSVPSTGKKSKQGLAF